MTLVLPAGNYLISGFVTLQNADNFQDVVTCGIADESANPTVTQVFVPSAVAGPPQIAGTADVSLTHALSTVQGTTIFLDCIVNIGNSGAITALSSITGPGLGQGVIATQLTAVQVGTLTSS